MVRRSRTSSVGLVPLVCLMEPNKPGRLLGDCFRLGDRLNQ
jgi:hypothetical protein